MIDPCKRPALPRQARLIVTAVDMIQSTLIVYHIDALCQRDYTMVIISGPVKILCRERKTLWSGRSAK